MPLPLFLTALVTANAVSLFELSVDSSLNLLQVGAREILASDHGVPDVAPMNETQLWNLWKVPLSDYISTLAGVVHHPAPNQKASCSPLKNNDAFFSVEVEVGTPSQRFDVVVDTGSDAVIIPSCICQEDGECSEGDRCYRGEGYSKTFHIEKEIPFVSLEFGSGTINSAIVSDIVNVGTVGATMKSSLLLMVDSELDFGGSFEGILGLGQLQADIVPEAKRLPEAWDQQTTPNDRRSKGPLIPGFLRMAGVETFSVCFNDGDEPGVLRLNTPRVAQSVPSYGLTHWGLNFLGMSVGAAAVPALFCLEGEECGAIPDSGTTLMLGPQGHVRNLFRGICELWPRCAAAANRDKSSPLEDHFQTLLFKCGDWMGEKGMKELPNIYLHFDGPTGGTTLEIPGWSYIFEAPAEMAGRNSKLLGGLVSQQLQKLQEAVASQSPHAYVCLPAFGSTDIELGTSPLWILGTPLFYEYVVNFDLKSSPPTVGFSSDQCGSCFEEEAVLAAMNTTIAPESFHEYLSRWDSHAKLRRIHSPLRVNKHPKQYVRHKR